MAEATYGSQLERSISRLPQTAYGAPWGSGASFRRIISESRAIADAKTTFVDDANYDNGSDVASEKWAETSDVSGALNPKFCFQDIGYFLLWALGGYSVSGPVASQYTHVFTPQAMNTSRQLPVRTMLEKWGGLNLRMLPDMYCSQLKLSGGKSGRLSTSATLLGSGAYADNPAGYTSPAIVADREWGYGGQANFSFNDKIGTKQKTTATAAGTTTGAGIVNAVVTAAALTGSPITVPVTVASGDTATVWAAKVRAALRNIPALASFMEVTGTTTAIAAEIRVGATTDATFNIALANGSPSPAITPAATSAATTAGITGGSYQPYTCALETWDLTIDNPLASDGYRACSPYVLPGVPTSGTTRSEALVGARKFTFGFTARLLAGDKMRGWMLNQTPLKLEIPIIGAEPTGSNLRIVHTSARVEVTGENDSTDNFFGLAGQVDLMSDPTVSSGFIPFTATLINDVVSYAT